MLKINKDVNFDPLCGKFETTNGSIYYTLMNCDFDFINYLDNLRDNCDFNNSELDKLMFMIYNS